jgi:N-acylneuraminate cytidylyltransferase
MARLLIIPARGGSKRIPRKNIKKFLGKPIIAYSIEAAKKAKCFDEIMVSTDDDEIAKVAKSFGAEVPFMRSAKTSGDHSMTAEAIEEVLREYKARKKDFSEFCCLYATAPFATSKRIKEAMRLLEAEKADCVLPVVRFSYPIQRSLRIKNGSLKMNWPENYNKRSQDLEPAYHDSGQFFCMKSNSLLKQKIKQKIVFYGKVVPLEIPEEEVQDIDTIEDWRMAELKYKLLRING